MWPWRCTPHDRRVLPTHAISRSTGLLTTRPCGVRSDRPRVPRRPFESPLELGEHGHGGNGGVGCCRLQAVGARRCPTGPPLQVRSRARVWALETGRYGDALVTLGLDATDDPAASCKVIVHAARCGLGKRCGRSSIVRCRPSFRERLPSLAPSRPAGVSPRHESPVVPFCGVGPGSDRHDAARHRLPRGLRRAAGKPPQASPVAMQVVAD